VSGLPTWLEATGLVIAALAVLVWVDSLRSRERALGAGRDACARYNVQLLDDTVAIARLGLERDSEGRLRLRRTYLFEFSDTGNNRRSGSIVMLGAELQDVQLEPYRLQ
jgi:hypothetical protein